MKNATQVFSRIFSNRIVANLLMIGLLAFGVFAYQNIRLSRYPDINYAWTNIRVAYPGAQPEIVENEVTDIIEKELGTVENIDLTMSVTMDQLCIIYVRTKFGTKNVDGVFNDVVRMVNSIELPVGTERPELLRITTSSVPILNIGLSCEIEGDNELTKRRLNTAAKQLEMQLKQVEGISEIRFSGKSEQIVQVEIDPYQLKEYGVSMSKVASVIRDNNFDSPGGSMRMGSENFSIRMKGKYQSIEDVRIVRIPSRHGSIQLKDIAKINSVFKEPKEIASVNMKQGIVMSIVKGQRVDSVRLIAEIRSKLKDIKTKLPAGVQVHYFADDSVDILKSLGVLEGSGVLGLIVVFFILWAFFGIRHAYYAAIGIPIAFSFCIIILYAMDISLNQVTLFGLVLILGVVVDDAIVVIENIYSKLEQGYYPYEAVKLGLGEIWLPVVSATLTTIAAFVPIFLTSGPVGNLLSFISVVVCLTLVGSLLECFFILPSHIIEGSDDGRPEVRFKSMKGLVMKVAKVSIQNGGKIIMVVVLLMVVSIAYLGTHNKEMFSNEDLRGFRIGVKTANGTDKNKTYEILEKYSKLIHQKYKGDIASISHTAGIFISDAFGTMVNRDTNYGQIYIELKDDSSLRLEEMMALTKDDLEQVPGIIMSWFVKLENTPIPERDVIIILRGDNYKTLEAMSSDLHAFFDQQPEVLSVSDDRYMGNKQVRVNVDRKRAALHDMTIKRLGFEVYRAIEGQNVGTLVSNNGDDDQKITLMVEGSAKKDLSQVKNLSVKTPNGDYVSLNEMATFEKTFGPSIIGHYNEKKSIKVTAVVDPRLSSVDEMSQRVEGVFTKLEQKYKGTTIQFIGGTDDIKKSFQELFYCFVVSLFFIYGILAIQFNSFTQPFLIMLMIPIGLIGVSFSLLIGGSPLSLFVCIGVIGLSGVIVNDSLVLISFFNNALDSGKSLSAAVMSGISRRYRPILITTITTIGGLLPAALGLSGKSLVWQPLAQTFIGGMMVATLSTLFVLPYIYITLVTLEGKLRTYREVRAEGLVLKLGPAPELKVQLKTLK